MKTVKARLMLLFMNEDDSQFYEFGEFILDPRRRVLIKNGSEIALTPRHFDLLYFLVRNEGRLLGHDEILDKVWDGAFVEQSNLKKGISALRRILEESAGDADYIKTVPRRGYSFVARVKPLADLTIERESVTEIEEIEEEYYVEEESEPVAPALPEKPKENPRLSRPMLFSLAALVLLFVTFIGWKVYSARAFAIEPVRMQMAALTNFGNVTGGTISRGGNLLLYSTKENGLTALNLKNLKSGEIRELMKKQAVRYYASAIAPDEKSVYFWLDDDRAPEREGMYRLSVEGGEPQKISANGWASMVFSPDGKQIAYHRGSINEQGDTGIFTADADGANERLVFNATAAGEYINFINWSPDNRAIVYVAVTVKDNRKEYSIRQVAIKNGKAETIYPPRPEPVSMAAWFPDGSALAVIARDMETQTNQVWRLSHPAGEWRQLTFGLNEYTASPSGFISADGKTVTVVQERAIVNLWTGQADGQNFRQITFDTLSYHPDCAWLDDETVLFSAKVNGNYEIWAVNGDGENRRQLTFDAATDHTPRATPDGRRILFLSNRSGVYQVWQMAADGTNPRQVTNSATEVGDFRILSDSQTIVYSVRRQGWTLFRKPIDKAEFKSLPFTDIAEWDVSPDDSFIAYSVAATDGTKIRLAALEDNKILKEFPAGDADSIVWTKDGKALLYDSYNERHDQIMKQSVEGGAPQPVTSFNSDENIWKFSISRDGRRIAARRVNQLFDIMQIKFD